MGRRSGIVFGVIGALVVGFILYDAYRVAAADRVDRQSMIAYEKHQYEQALQYSTRAVQLNPTANILADLAFIQYQLGHYHEAIDACTRALARADKEDLDPRAKAVLDNFLAWIYATAPDPTVQDGKKAVQHAIIACNHDGWRTGAYIDTLAAAYARSGNYPEAIRYQEEAISIENDRKSIREYRRHLERYQNHKPYTEKPGD